MENNDPESIKMLQLLDDISSIFDESGSIFADIVLYEECPVIGRNA